MFSRRHEDALFRHTAHGREALAPAGESANHVHCSTTSKAGVGAITSRSGNYTFWQYLAFELAGGGDPSRAIVPFCTVRQAQELHAKGLVK